MENIYNYIFRINTTNYSYGCGFFAGKYFITAGHVIDQSENPHIVVNGEEISLVYPKIVRNEKNSADFDVAIYELPVSVDSPFEFMNELPERGAILDSHSFKEIVIRNNDANNNCLDYIQLDCEATAGDFDDNYFSVLTSRNLKKGCSGSPLFAGNKVAGIIIAGNNDGHDECCDKNLPLNFCLVLSSQSILGLIAEIEKG